MQIEEMKVGYHKKVALKEVFPISPRYALRKSLGWACVLVPFILLCTLSSFDAQLGTLERSIISWAQAGAIALLVLNYLRADLYRRSFNYEMEGLRFVVSRGVLIKTVGSLPLLPISEIYIQRSFPDILCGLANLDIFTPMDQTRKFARIEALSPADAHRLQTFLGDLLTTQVFLNPAASEETALRDIQSAHSRHDDPEISTTIELPMREKEDLPVQWRRPSTRPRTGPRGGSHGPLRLL
jgi:uncharacterized membrane protein YdbT with pleckstrin-like domain